MLKLFAVFIALAQLQISSNSGSKAIDYDDQKGWGGVCNKDTSKKQSPVDVILPWKGTIQKEARVIELSENADSTGATNTQDKNSIKISFKKQITYKIPGLKEITGKVEQLHLHWGKNDNEGSEHLLNGTRFSAEAHLVTSYEDKSVKKNAVIARFFKVGAQNPQIKKMIDSTDTDGSDLEISDFNLTALYPSSIHNVTVYEGSLTTPDCTENVHWIIVPEPLTISTKQLESLRTAVLGGEDGAAKTFNWRKEQALHGRKFTCHISFSSQMLPSVLLLLSVILNAIH